MGDQGGFSSAPSGSLPLPADQSNPVGQQQLDAAATNSNDKEPHQQDLLKSKLLIGEFVILSQNYSHSPAHKSLLAENLVKLVSFLEVSSTFQ